MYRLLIHYGIHLLVPIAIGLGVKTKKLQTSIILLSGIVIDIDHLWANPIFDPDRCSIAFHPLHGYWAIGFYILLLSNRKTRLWGAAFLIHILADTTDCLLISLES